MRVLHRPAEGAERTLATDVEVADSVLGKARGLMFRRSIPGEYALVFPFDIDAVWLVDGRVERVKRLRAWRGYGRARGDTVLELPAGAADGVEPGDEVVVVDEDG